MKEAAKNIIGHGGEGRSPSDMFHGDAYAEDDQSGSELLPKLVKEARKAEIEYFRSMGGLRRSPHPEVLGRHRRRPLSL